MKNISSYTRKPFTVQAVQVTEENLKEVAQWCEGSLFTDETSEEGAYIKVEVLRPMNERQTKAFVDDWVLRAGTGFKVYTNKAFEKSFDLAKDQGAPIPRPPKRRVTAMQAAWQALDPEERAKYESQASVTAEKTPSTITKEFEPQERAGTDVEKAEVEAEAEEQTDTD